MVSRVHCFNPIWTENQMISPLSFSVVEGPSRRPGDPLSSGLAEGGGSGQLAGQQEGGVRHGEQEAVCSL